MLSLGVVAVVNWLAQEVLTGMIACADVEPARDCFETRSVFRWKVPGMGRRGRRSVGESRLVKE